MRKAFIQLLSGVPHIPLLYPNLGRPEQEGRMGFLNNAFDGFTLRSKTKGSSPDEERDTENERAQGQAWQQAATSLIEPFVALVDDPAAADFILIPHNFAGIQDEKQYLHESADLAQRHGKRIVIFWHGDSDAEVDLPNALVFRTSQYRSSKRANEIMMPAYAPDLLEGRAFSPRSKGEMPVVGFCGWARYKNLKNRAGTYFMNAYTKAFMGQESGAKSRIKGITLRMKALKILEESGRVQTNFLLRSSYSGSPHTIRIDPEKGREEYVQNMLASDFPLVIKGDGNYSYRFYEALSLGRVPVLLDTECVLPLEDVVSYDECILRIPLEDLSVIDRRVRTFWNSIDDEKYGSMQRAAREMFEKYLCIGSFLKYAVEHLM